MVAIASCGLSPSDPSPLPASLFPGTVVLLTNGQGGVGCPLNVVEGDLVVDDTAGTAIIDSGVRKPIRWPYGYSGRRNGVEVDILDAEGTVIGRTGTSVRLNGGETVPGIWLACPGSVTPR